MRHLIEGTDVPARGRPLRVLLVEDDPAVAEILVDILSERATGVIHAENVARGRIYLSRENFDLLVADVLLADGSGFEVAGLALTRDIPALMISGDVSFEEDCRRRGLPFLGKPFETSALFQALEECLANPRTSIESHLIYVQPPRLLDCHLGRKIRQRRMNLSLSIVELSSRLSLSSSDLRDIEEGVVRITAKWLIRLAEALAVSISFFFQDISGQTLSCAEDHKIIENSL